MVTIPEMRFRVEERLTPEELERLRETRAWRIFQNVLKTCRDEQMQKLVKLAKSQAEFPTTESYAVEVRATGCYVDALDKVLALPERLLQQEVKEEVNHA